jgi:hypothetical protein
MEPFIYICDYCGYQTQSSEINLTRCPIPLTSDGTIDDTTPLCGGDLWGPTIDISVQNIDSLLATIARKLDGPTWELLENAAHHCIEDTNTGIVRRWSPEAVELAHHILNPNENKHDNTL